MTITHICEACGGTVEGADMEAFGDAYIVHVHDAHTDWPFPDIAIRNYAEATQRLSTDVERRETIGEIEVRPVTEDRVPDFLSFFDGDAFAGKPEWAACYCVGHHLNALGEVAGPKSWQENREAMDGLLREGKAYGYLAYVEGKPAGWVNASMRSDYALFRMGEKADVPDDKTITVSCFVIAPPYRRHGLAATMLDRVLADAPTRGAKWIDAFPTAEDKQDAAENFHGPKSLYESRGFTPVRDVFHLSQMRKEL